MFSGIQSYARFIKIVWILLIITNTTFSMKCPHCNMDYKVLGRHVWRCQSKGTSTDHMNDQLRHTLSANADAPPEPTTQSGNSTSTFALEPDDSVDWHVCHCGRRCKGRRGLRAHQRSCRTMATLLDDDPNIDRTAFSYTAGAQADDDAAHSTPASSGPAPLLNPVRGLKLPRDKAAWDEANAFFHSSSPLPTTIDSHNIDECVEKFQSAVYEHFQSEHGLHSKRAACAKHVNNSKRSLKKRLKDLKASKAPTDQIRSVSQALRRMMPDGSKTNASEIRSNSKQYKANPWRFIASC